MTKFPHHLSVHPPDRLSLVPFLVLALHKSSGLNPELEVCKDGGVPLDTLKCARKILEEQGRERVNLKQLTEAFQQLARGGKGLGLKRRPCITSLFREGWAIYVETPDDPAPAAE